MVDLYMGTWNNVENAKKFSKKKQIGKWYYDMEFLGYNYRITDILCALGISQLLKIDSFIKRRQEIAKIYDENFKSLNNVYYFQKFIGKINQDQFSDLRVLVSNHRVISVIRRTSSNLITNYYQGASIKKIELT